MSALAGPASTRLSRQLSEQASVATKAQPWAGGASSPGLGAAELWALATRDELYFFASSPPVSASSTILGALSWLRAGPV